MTGRVIVTQTGINGLDAAFLLDNDTLVDALFRRPDDPAPMTGDIAMAKVDRIAGSAAFVKLGDAQKGYLRDAKRVSAGDSCLVQIASLPEAGKAYPVTRRILFKRRCIIATPGAPGVNLSRDIREDEDRARLSNLVKEVAASIDAPADMGYIVRSAALSAPDADIVADVKGATPPDGQTTPFGGTHTAFWAAHPHEIALRDWTSPLPERLIVDPSIHDAVLQGDATSPVATLLAASSALTERLEPSRPDTLDLLGIADQIDALRHARVDLGRDAFLYIEPTRACVTVDVNTGGDFSPAAGLKATLAAIRDLPRQLRLRGLGGVIVIDPAPVAKKDRRTVENALKQAFKSDPVQTSVAGWTPLGHIELQRKRERRPLHELIRW